MSKEEFQKVKAPSFPKQAIYNKVEVQREAIDPNPMTLKQMTHEERQRERNEEMNMLRFNQKQSLKVPKG